MMTWFDRLCARINPPMPDAMQAMMLREVWRLQKHRRVLPAFLFSIPKKPQWRGIFFNGRHIELKPGETLWL